ncbi:MAG: protein adenylyltransferase SelO [Cycloclasticus sp.]
MTLDELSLDTSYIECLPADPQAANFPRQVHGACFSWVMPTKTSAARLLAYSADAAALLDLTDEDCASKTFSDVFSGNQLLTGSKPYATSYGGHQFGNWAGQLGDGRAINLCSIVNKRGESWALQLKGAGPTPYSRTADGYAVLRSSLREFLCSEAMFYLRVPTTRALSLMTTGDTVVRDVLYDGNPQPEQAAVVCRLAPSFTRFGHFQYYAEQSLELLKVFTDYTIQSSFSHLGAPDKACYIRWFNEVCESSCDMVVEWMRVGFVHGVMNTDNMSILGLTIDYGPYGWLEAYDPSWTPNTTDANEHRYAFSQQAKITHWNLYQLANAIYPLIEETEGLELALRNFAERYARQWLLMMNNKLGFTTTQHEEEDRQLVEQLLAFFALYETDMTIFFRRLAMLDPAGELDFEGVVQQLSPAFYEETMPEAIQQALRDWLKNYWQRCQQASTTASERRELMNKTNPKYVLRNYLAQQAIEMSEQGDQSLLHELLAVLKSPYDEQPEKEHFNQKRPDWAKHKVGCSMLSCSS